MCRDDEFLFQAKQLVSSRYIIMSVCLRVVPRRRRRAAHRPVVQQRTRTEEKAKEPLLIKSAPDIPQ